MGSIIVPESGLRNAKLTAIPGVPPNLKNPPAGCRFAERCKYVRAECRVTAVPLYEVGYNRAYRCILTEDRIEEGLRAWRITGTCV
jgi:peptide/nickel transport system ATP-binding protein